MKTVLMSTLAAFMAVGAQAATLEFELTVNGLNSPSSTAGTYNFFDVLGIASVNTATVSFAYDDTAVPTFQNTLVTPVGGSRDIAYYEYLNFSVDVGAFSVSLPTSEFADNLRVTDYDAATSTSGADSAEFVSSTDQMLAPIIRLNSVRTFFRNEDISALGSDAPPPASFFLSPETELSGANGFRIDLDILDDNGGLIGRSALFSDQRSTYEIRQVSVVPLPAGLPLLLSGIGAFWALGRKTFQT